MGLGTALNQGAKAVANAVQAPSRVRAISFLQQATLGFDSDHMRYCCERNILLWGLIPPPVQGAVDAWAGRYLDLVFLPDEQLMEAAKAARPDCAALFASPAGEKWLRELVKALRPV